VLVEAIKARQNQNEQAVAAILEANRQRRNMRRQQQLEHQQMLLKITNGKIKILCHVSKVSSARILFRFSAKQHLVSYQKCVVC